jgi:uncharacterized protein (DUF4415 family)
MGIQFAKKAAPAQQPKPKQPHPKPGRPPSGKVRLTLLVDPDIIEAFRATGPGWQARINESLRKAKP